jgi:hypothetical protein
MIWASLLSLVLISGDGIGSPDTRVRNPSPEAARLLNIVANRDASYKERVAAVERLGKLRDPGSVPDLLQLLPGEGDVIILRVIVVLEQLGDSSALPVLRGMRDSPKTKLPGKINAVLHHTIAKLEGK